MTPEAINRAIAEWRGWKLCTAPILGGGMHSWWEHPDLKHFQELPDYCHDLNAIQGAVLDGMPNQVPQGFYHPLSYEYENNLHIATGGTPYSWNGWAVLNATAAQRCEALLRTLGLWKEEA